MRGTTRNALGAMALAWATGACSAEVEPARRSLLSFAEGATWTTQRGRRIEERLRCLEVRDGLAIVELRLETGQAREEARIETPEGVFPMLRWDLPLPPAPEILSRSEEPQLGGIDLPRLVDPSVPIETERGLWYVGPDDAGVACLRVTVPSAEVLPVAFPLRYAVEAARLIPCEGPDGSLAAGLSPADVLRGRRADGDRTTEGWTLPTGSTVRIPLPAHGAERLRARLVAPPADGGRHVELRFEGGPKVKRAFLARGGAVELDVLLGSSEASAVEIGVSGARDSLVYIEEPRLEPVRSALESADDPPNVCLVVIDTLRADRLEPGRMPQLSSLSDECLTFENCWSTCSWTLPSVTTMLTSNHGGQHQAWLNDQPLGEGVTTLAEAFRDAGYRTAAFTGGVFVDQVYGLDRGFSVFDSSAGGAQAVTERALEWVDGAGDGPWFLLVHTYQVHAPYQPPEPAFGQVLRRHPGVLGERRPEPQAFHDEQGVVQGDLGAIAALLADLYDEGVRYTDGVFGEFFDALQDRGVFDGLVLAVTSDHGEEFGEHGMLGHTDTLYREQLRVPLLLRFPGAARAGRDARPVSHLDLAPTLLDAAGLAPDIESFAGRSLLAGGDASPIYATRHIEEIGVLRALVSDGHAFVDGPYIYSRSLEGPELYDLTRDPEQLDNRYGSSAQRWSSLLDRLSDRFDEPKVEPRKISSGQVQRELREMGYL